MKLQNAQFVAQLAADHEKHLQFHRALSDARKHPQGLKINLSAGARGDAYGPVIDIPISTALNILDSRRREIEESLKQFGVEL